MSDADTTVLPFTKPEWLARVRIELDELLQRLTRLTDFVGTEPFYKLHYTQQYLLTKQKGQMERLAETLAQRIAHAESLPPETQP